MNVFTNAQLVVLLGLGLCGCVEPPARRLITDCEPLCLSEMDVLMRTHDDLVVARSAWRFYDDLADTLDSACDGGPASTDTLRPLWRRAVYPFNPRVPRGSLDRAGLAVHPGGRIAVGAGTKFWILAADGGVPEHIFESASSDPEFVAFADADRLWINESDSPALINLARWDKLNGPTVEYSWQETHPLQPGLNFGSWIYSSPSVLSDGTLVWTANDGYTRAISTDGGTRWEVRGVEGYALVDSDDVVFWTGNTPLGRDRFGAVAWEPQVSPTWSRFGGIPLEDGPVPDHIPMLYSDEQWPGAFVAFIRRQDGAVAATLGPDAGRLWFDRAAVGGDGTLFIVDNDRPAKISAFQAGVRRFSVESPWLDMGFIAGRRSDRLFITTEDCRVSVLDRTGAVIASHQMLGRSTRFQPKLLDGVLYVVAETTLPKVVVMDEMKGTRPDGSVISVSDYECVQPGPCRRFWVQPGPLYVLYAFQVE